MVNDITIEDGRATAVTLEDERFTRQMRLCLRSRPRADWFSHICNSHGIETEVGTVVSIVAWKSATRSWSSEQELYEAKLFTILT